MKHFVLRGQSSTSQPSLLWEIRLDIHDVRSGYHGTDLALYSGPYVEEADIDFSPDLVARLDPAELEEVGPPRRLRWPDGVDELITRYLLQHHRIPVWRNYQLGLYSAAHETKDDFIARCLSFLREERNADHQKNHDIFLRRFLELEQALLAKTEEEWPEPEPRERMISYVRDLFSDFREDFSRSFLREDLDLLSENDLNWTGKIDIEFQERIHKLRADLVSRYNEINQESKQKSKSVERYEVPLGYDQIEIVSRDILWT